MLTNDLTEAHAWRLPVDRPHRLGRRSGGFCFVGGAADHDATGSIMNPGDMLGQIAGAIENASATLEAQGCDLNDVIRLKAFFITDSEDSNGWALLKALRSKFLLSPAPVISMQPTAMMPWNGQKLQLQAIAVKNWRQQEPIRFVTESAPEGAHGDGSEYSVGLRAAGFFAVSDVPGFRDGFGGGDAVAETNFVLDRLAGIMRELDVSWSDSIKKEGYYLGNTMADWEPMAAARAARFPAPGPVATVVPWHEPWPCGSRTKIELLGYRSQLGEHSKPAPRSDSWPDWVWDWPISVPYRQGTTVKGCAWIGGQVPWGAGRTMRLQASGDLNSQVDFTLGLIGDILNGLNRRIEDLAMLICYFESDGTDDSTRRFLERLALNIPGPLPPLTLVPQPTMHSPEMKTEIWGVACA